MVSRITAINMPGVETPIQILRQVEKPAEPPIQIGGQARVFKGSDIREVPLRMPIGMSEEETRKRLLFPGMPRDKMDRIFRERGVPPEE